MHPHVIAHDGRVPLHAGHLARNGGRRRAARRAADADLVSAPNADGVSADPAGRRARATTSATSAPTSSSRSRRGPYEWVHRDELVFQPSTTRRSCGSSTRGMEVEEATRPIEARDLAGALRLLGRANHAMRYVILVPRAPRADVAVGRVGGECAACSAMALASTRPASAGSGRSRPASTPPSRAVRRERGLSLLEVYTQGPPDEGPVPASRGADQAGTSRSASGASAT